MSSIKYIKSKDKVLAIVIFNSFDEEGLKFPTPDDFPLQVGIHVRKCGSIVKPHKHNPLENIDKLPFQEIFHVEKGEIEVGIYDYDDQLYEKIRLKMGDIVLFNSGHSIKFVEDSKVIEVKQGPYRSDDKMFI
ncbi:hypothetical protein CMO93_01930 [Candidatus Woesearchaeota archaeon]|nr:hypothetical protein [Candidatus Woesearchaeota archaeon]|tara:strand:+ start:1097 stop:1495 length:399 start_codon:yes stop_codon:yes gene_type:complete